MNNLKRATWALTGILAALAAHAVYDHPPLWLVLVSAIATTAIVAGAALFLDVLVFVLCHNAETRRRKFNPTWTPLDPEE